MVVNRVGFRDFQTEIYHMCKLFFSDVEVSFESMEDAEMVISIYLETLQAASTVQATAKLEITADQTSWVKKNERNWENQYPEQRRKTMKRAVGFALLQVLQEVTGIEQPWGILTGVRPTKLLHNMRQQHSREACMRMLVDEYLVTDSKAKLLTDIVDKQLAVIPDLFHLDREVSIYIGIPFCPTKCAYCTFPAYDIRGNNGSVNGFLLGLHEEIREIGKWLRDEGLKITTIYWGGGTPTSIEADQMDALFVTLHEAMPGMDQIRELTVEAGRPDTITAEKLEVMKRWNVDRISINPQSFTQNTLDTIGRHHSVEETIDKFMLSRQMGIKNINMDLIIGLPNEGVREFQHTLEQVEKLLPESLTVHTLSFKRASRMSKNKEQYDVAERDEITAMMKMADDWTTDHQYQPYYLYRQKNILGNLENVGYSLSGQESLYNILMMEERQTIIGLGCGAVSKICFPLQKEENDQMKQRIERFPNPKEPAAYNASYKQYLEKKINLLNEAYAMESMSF